MRGLIVAGAILLSLTATAISGPIEEILKCRDESDSLKRLTCYDGISAVGDTISNKAADAKATSGQIIATDIKLRHQGKNFDREVFQPRVEAIPTFKNGTNKTLVAVEITIVISDAFGEKIINGRDKLDIKIPPGKTAQSKVFFYWEDNPFINNQPYDKLVGPVDTGVAKVEMKVLKAVFSDGSVEEYAKS